jgi:drug/metabolite transporter (DMT)-like permease
MNHQIKYWIGWIYQSVFGLLLGILAGFLIAINPRGGRGLLRSSDTLPFVLGMGLLGVVAVAHFCRRMNRGRSETVSTRTLNPGYLFSLAMGLLGFVMIAMSFMRTYRILPR